MNCYGYGSNMPNISLSTAVSNAGECRVFCSNNSLTYAAVYNGTSCLCSDDRWTSIVTMENCNITCGSNTCGGTGAVSLYIANNLIPFVSPQVRITSLNVTILPGVVVPVNTIVNLQMFVSNGTEAGFKVSTGVEVIFTAFLTKSFSYTQPGLYSLTVRALNEISFYDYQTFLYVFRPIEDIIMPILQPENTSSIVNVFVNVTGGINITCDINFGNNVTDSLFNRDDSELFKFFVMYKTPNVYFINVTCYNSVTSLSNHTCIIIQDPVVVNSFVIPVIHIYPTGIFVTWSLTQGTNVTFLLRLDGVATGVEQYTSGSLDGSAVIPVSMYKTLGLHTIALSSSNRVSSASSSQVINIQRPVSAVFLTVNNTHHPVNSTIRFEITLPEGSNISVSLTVEPANVLTSHIPGLTNNGHLFFDHLYTAPGTYVVSVSASNVHGSVTNTTTVFVEVPVSSVNCSVLDSPNPNVSINMMCFVPSPSQIPSNAIASVSFGDGNVNNVLLVLLPSLSQSFSNQYVTHGFYDVLVKIQNNVSHIYFNRSVQVGGPVTDLCVTVNRMFIPLGLPLIVTSDISFGSLVTYRYDFGDGMQVTRPSTYSYPTAEDVIQHTYTIAKDFQLVISAENTFFTFKKEVKKFTIKVQDKINGITLISTSPVKMRTNMHFVLYANNIGTGFCFVLNLGDGTSKRFGDSSCLQRPEFTSVQFEEKTTFPMVIYHTYQTKGQFNVTVNSSNAVSWDFTVCPVTVHEFLCIEPRVEILGFTKSLSSIVPMKRSQRFLISANVETSCTPPIDTVYEWKIHTSHGTIVNPPANGLPSLTFPSNYLSYGIYTVSLRVSYAYGSTLNATDFVYVEIQPSQLVCEISEGYLRHVYYKDDLVIDGSRSRDPDQMKGTSQGLNHKWYCRLNSETLPMDGNLPSDVPLITSSGCFDNGVGFLSQGTTNLTVPYTDLQPSSEYIFTLVVTKDNRYDMKEHHVITTVKQMPHARIR